MDLLTTANKTPRIAKSRPVRIAIIITQKTNDLHATVPCFLWRKARYAVDLISAEAKASIMLEMRIHVRCDNTLSKTNFNQYTAAFIPHGNTTRLVEIDKLRKDLEKFVYKPKGPMRWLFSSGNGACVLKEFDLIAPDQLVTVQNEKEMVKLLGKNFIKQPVHVDKNIISCANSCGLTKFSFKVIEELSGIELARKTANLVDHIYKG